ncbi:PREDICTED: uncharacterized protein LOC104075643 [Fulmarus glacialis]|uniref:uncharacterized protein LOC104075643 n=1 Tax=Fulmarus glacialis TaxID=30455 RepID=UPI00051B032F|nr:PREDICTED: uncharacterized protein LOC104075643 [Fulmarus glacialis]
MAFLDNPTIILAHIRQSHVTSDDTGMCEMVLIDHDVDLEKFNPSSAYGDSGSETQGSNGETQGYVYSQSVDITSSWDFGIRRRSNTAQRLERLRKERQNQIKCKNVQWKDRNTSYSAEELSSLFEKKNFRVKSPCSGKQSILSVRLEQCPLQLNNPFNEYSKFDGKSQRIDKAVRRWGSASGAEPLLQPPRQPEPSRSLGWHGPTWPQEKDISVLLRWKQAFPWAFVCISFCWRAASGGGCLGSPAGGRSRLCRCDRRSEERRVPGWAALVKLRFRPLAVGAAPVPALAARAGVLAWSARLLCGGLAVEDDVQQQPRNRFLETQAAASCSTRFKICTAVLKTPRISARYM